MIRAPLGAYSEPRLSARHGPEGAFRQQVDGAGAAPVPSPGIALADEGEHGLAVRLARAEEVEVAVPGGRIGRRRIVRQDAQRLVYEARVDPIALSHLPALSGEGGIGVQGPAGRKIVARRKRAAQASRLAGSPGQPHVVQKRITDQMRGGADRRKEMRIGGGDVENAGRGAAQQRIVALTEPQVR